MTFLLSMVLLAVDPVVDINALKAEITASSLQATKKTLLKQVLDLAITRINQMNYWLALAQIAHDEGRFADEASNLASAASAKNAAVAVLGTFKTYVQNFINSGALDAVAGQHWKDEADAIIAEL